MRRILAALTLAALLTMPATAPTGAQTPTSTVHPAYMTTHPAGPVRASSNGHGLISVSAPASATAWRVRAGRDNRYLEVIVEHVAGRWTGSIRWEHRTRTGLRVDRLIPLTSFLLQSSDALGGCDLLISLCAVSFQFHLPTVGQPRFSFFFTSTGNGQTIYYGTGAAWIVSHGRWQWVYGGEFRV